MHRIVALALALAVAFPGLTSAPRARADDAAESRFHDRVGRRAFEARRYDAALESFLRAQRAAPSPRGLFNVALCARLAHRDTLAFASFEALLGRADVDAALRGEAQAARDALAHTLALVHVTSEPEGATIYVDRRDLGSYGSTPITLALPAGTHTLELERADHESTRVSVEATVGSVRDARATLAPHLGQLTIEVTAPGATLLAQRGEVSVPLSAGTTADLPVGRYTVLATAPGFAPASVEVLLTAGSEEHRTVALAATPAPSGRVLISTGDVHARVRVDAEDRAETPARLGDLPVGPHHIEVAAEGWHPWAGDVVVEEDRTTFLSITLVPLR